MLKRTYLTLTFSSNGANLYEREVLLNLGFTHTKDYDFVYKFAEKVQKALKGKKVCFK